MSRRPSRSAAAAPPEPQLRRGSVPVREPRAASRVRPLGLDGPPPTQGTLALVIDPPATSSRAGGHRSGPDGAGRPGSASEPVGALPEPREWATTFALAAMEVASGLRPAGQLVRWTSPEVHEALSLRGALNARRRQAPVTPVRTLPRLSPAGRKVFLRALVAGMPVDGVCEVAAVVRGPDRIRAVAFRMEGHAGRWRVTALQIG